MDTASKTMKDTSAHQSSDTDTSLALTLELFDPGMGLFHRAGLAGLVSTLQWIERNVPVSERPPGSWRVEPRTLVLQAPDAEAFLSRLYALAFQVRDGLFIMPGKFPLRTPPVEVLATMHRAVTSTFYSHKPSTCGKSRRTHVREYEVDRDVVAVSYDEWTRFGHAEMYCDLVKDRRLSALPVAYKGGVCPGAMERHAALNGTEAADSAARVLCLHFAIVACLALPGRNSSSGIIVVPEVDSLCRVQAILQALVPSCVHDCHVAGASDAAFQAELRLTLDMQAGTASIPACVGMTTAKKPWQAFSRDSVVRVNPADSALDLYRLILDHLPSRCLATKKQAKEGSAHFWKPSVCRALFADNLAKGHAWYQDFHRRFASKALTTETLYERKELQTMVEKIPWNDTAEHTLVRSVHEAMRRRFGAIAAENTGSPIAMRNRLKREAERLRLALAGAKTQADFRHTITSLWSRTGSLPELQENWTEILPFLSESRWQHGRDLALLALASYKGRSGEELEALEGNSGTETETEETN